MTAEDFRALWLNRKRKRFWLLVAIILYTFAGFIIAPWVLKHQLVSILATKLNSEVAIDRVAVNPYALSVEVSDFTLAPQHEEPTIAFKRLKVNFELSSIFYRAWTFKELTLEAPRVELVRFNDGTINLQQFVPNAEKDEEVALDEAPSDNAIPRLRVKSLNLIDGNLNLEDRTHSRTFHSAITPINLTLKELSTLPGKKGSHFFKAVTENGAVLTLQGDLQLNPLHINVNLQAQGPFLETIDAYLEYMTTVTLDKGQLELAANLDIQQDDTGQWLASVKDAEIAVNDLSISDKASDEKPIKLQHLTVGPINIEWPAKKIQVKDVVIDQPDLTVTRLEDGTFNLQHFLKIQEQPQPTKTTPPSMASTLDESTTELTENHNALPGEPPTVAAPEKPLPKENANNQADNRLLPDWQINVDKILINNLQASYLDKTVPQQNPLEITNTNLSITNINNQAGALFPVEFSTRIANQGQIMADGNFGLFPTITFTANLVTTDLPLSIAEPYVMPIAQISIQSGTLNTTLTLSGSDSDKFHMNGDLSIHQLEVINGKNQRELIGWETVNVDNINYSLAKNALEIDLIDLLKPAVRLRIYNDSTTNFQRILVDRESPKQGGRPDQASDLEKKNPFHLLLGKIAIGDATANFRDNSLPIPFTAMISNLNGMVTTVDSQSSEAAAMSLEGKVDDYGQVKIDGALSPFKPKNNTQVGILFRNLSLPDLSPYTVKFAGRKIDEGKMFLDLKYAVQQGQLKGKNNIVINSLKLGDKVEQEGAMDLPLDLAVALLKGPDGKIDIDLPVEGDMNQPEFRLSGVITKAFFNLITKAATAPFRLLASLVGVEASDFDRIAFAPGETTLTPPEQEKIVKLAEALQQRPQLVLEITPAYDPKRDKYVLQRQGFDNKLAAQLGTSSASNEKSLAKKELKIIERMFEQTLPDTPLKSIMDKHYQLQEPQNPNSKRVLDETAYKSALRKLLIDRENVSDQQLIELADQRAGAISNALVTNQGLDPARVVTIKLKTREVDKNDLINTMLKISSR